MAKPADDAVAVLEILRALYDLGGAETAEAEKVWESLSAQGIDGIEDDDGPFYLMIGTVLRLLLRHAGADVDGMFAAARSDLHELGLDIDELTFEEIAMHFNEEDSGS